MDRRSTAVTCNDGHALYRCCKQQNPSGSEDTLWQENTKLGKAHSVQDKEPIYVNSLAQFCSYSLGPIHGIGWVWMLGYGTMPIYLATCEQLARMSNTFRVLAPPSCLLRFCLSSHLNRRLPSFPLDSFLDNVLGTAILSMCYDLQHAGSGGGIAGCHVIQGVIE